MDRYARRHHSFMRALGAGLIIAGCGTCGTAPPDAPPPPGALRPVEEASRSATPDTLRVLAYNIHHGEGMDERVDLGRIAAFIREVNPDLVTLQEVDRGVERTGRVDQAARLAELTGMEAVFGAFMPYQGGEYGMAVLSRWPVVSFRNHRLPDGAEPRTALAVRVRAPGSGREVVVVGIHLYRTAEERLAQARALAGALEGESVPVILAGDFNSTPGSEVMEYLAEGWVLAPKGSDHLTFPSYAPEREIDFVLYRPAARVEILEHRPLHEPVASDHRPLVATLLIH